jgi:O-antigen biosynthesis protein
MAKKLNILVLTEHLPQPDRSAGCRRLIALIEILAINHNVDLFTEYYAPELTSSLTLLKSIGVNVIPPAKWGWYRGILLRKKYHAGLFEFWHTAERLSPEFRKYQPWAKVLIDSVDIHFAREESAVPLGLVDPNIVENNRKREISIYQSADAIIATTKEDKQLLLNIGKMPMTFVIPVIVPTIPRTLQTRQLEVLFVGGFKHPPNVDAVNWFIREIWPKVRKQVPTSNFTIVGDAPPPEIANLSGHDGVTVTGYVPETKPYLERAAVSVAPLRYGAGMKGKVSEALAAGVPVVCTTFGSQGFDMISGRDAFITDSSDQFADYVIQLLNDSVLARDIGEAGKRLAEGICTSSAARGVVESMINEVMITPSNHSSLTWQLKSINAHVKTYAYDVYQKFRSIRARFRILNKSTATTI